MSLMIAVNTIHGRRRLAVDEVLPGQPNARSVDIIAKPGDKFETADMGIAADEEQQLVDRGVAMRLG
ncbi:MAG: hypothetical protein JWO28_2637 [Hyphomicrobiales bacterium]|nr:hypothetical protein [Hyphomicrobiales bacterium]